MVFAGALAFGGCANLLGIHEMSFDGSDGGMPNGGGQLDGEIDADMGSDGLGGGPEAPATSDAAMPHDASDADLGQDAPDTSPPPQPGVLACAGTMGTSTCNLLEGQFCCVQATGTTTQDGGIAWLGATANCDDEVDGAFSEQCGGIDLSNGNMTTLASIFLQGCARKSDCPSGDQYCCATLGDAGPAAMGLPAVSDLECAAAPCSGVVVCAATSDCPSGKTCVRESNPVLSHLWWGTCL